MATTVIGPAIGPVADRSDNPATVHEWRRVVRWLMPAGAILVLGAGLTWWRERPIPVSYTTAPVTRGAIVRTVIATGSVNPVVTVQVGAFVSGTVQTLYCDYNTQVKPNQLCAKIDPRPYQVVVDENAAALGSARAQLVKDQAALAYAQVTYDRLIGLFKKGIVDQDTVDNNESALDQAIAEVVLDSATITEREAQLQAADVNLQYTNIVSPVQGTVISRNVDVGQTVAASFQTPMLFLVAQDLTKMQVDANVSESDIGSVAVGQRGTFTVEAYPNRTFIGRVAQIRRGPITVQNVVTYDVVIAVANPDLLLLPGMTADTRIVAAERDDVVRVPLQALRYAPNGLDRDAGGAGATPGEGRVWVLRGGQALPVAVNTGMDDGTLIEVTSGALSEGDQIVTGDVPRAHGAAGSTPALHL